MKKKEDNSSTPKNNMIKKGRRSKKEQNKEAVAEDASLETSRLFAHLEHRLPGTEEEKRYWRKVGGRCGNGIWKEVCSLILLSDYRFRADALVRFLIGLEPTLVLDGVEAFPSTGAVVGEAVIVSASISMASSVSSSSSISVNSSLGLRASVGATDSGSTALVPTMWNCFKYHGIPPSVNGSTDSFPRLSVDWGGVGGVACAGFGMAM